MPIEPEALELLIRETFRRLSELADLQRQTVTELQLLRAEVGALKLATDGRREDRERTTAAEPPGWNGEGEVNL